MGREWRDQKLEVGVPYVFFVVQLVLLLVKTYGCAPLSGEESDANLFAPRDVDIVQFVAKDDVKGIGYQGLDPSAALHQHKTQETKTFMGIAGKGFGTGALEDEDEEDVYVTDHLSNYSKTIDVAGAESGYSWTGAGIGGVIGKLEYQFVIIFFKTFSFHR